MKPCNKKNKWYVSILLSVVCLIFGITFSCVNLMDNNFEDQNVESATAPDNTNKFWTDSGCYSADNWFGSGTENDPYLIRNAKDLARLSYMIYYGQGEHSGNYYYQNTYFKQDGDIDLSAYYWQPIGIMNLRGESTQTLRYFSGNYDGNGFYISGLFTKSDISAGAGVFGVVAGLINNYSVIKSVSVIDSLVSAGASVGGIVGWASNVEIRNCYNISTIKGNSNIGGIVGYLSTGNIVNCINRGLINPENENAGGIVGEMTGNSKVINCVSLGMFSYMTNANIGGIAGNVRSSASVSNSYYFSQYINSGIGSGQSGAISFSNANNLKSVVWFRSENNSYGISWNTSYSWDFDNIWEITNRNDGFPSLRQGTASRLLEVNLNGGSLKTDGNLFGSILDQGSASSLIYNDDASYYISNQNIYINSVNTSNNNTCFMHSLNAYLSANKTYELSFKAVSRNSNVLNSHIDGGMFLDAEYVYFYHNDEGPIVNSTTTPVTMVNIFTPKASGKYTLRIDPSLNNAKYRIFDLTLVEITNTVNNNLAYLATENSKTDLLNPTREGYDFAGWKLTGGGNFSTGFENCTGNFTPNSVQKESNGVVYTKFHNEWDKPSGDVWYGAKFPTYYFTPGHEYEINYDLRINTMQGGVAIDFRHSRVENDWSSPCGNPRYSTSNGWEHFTMSQVFNATSDRGGEVETKPVFEIYTGNLATSTTSKIIYDYDLKNLVVIDKTTNTLAWSSNIYTFGNSDGVLTAQWEAKTYNITLNKQSGSGGTSSVVATYGQHLPQLTSLPTRAGYNFEGYFSGINGTGVKYYNANGTSAKVYELAQDITLYAHWTSMSYAVMLDSQGGQGGTELIIATYNQSLPSLSSLPTKEGYVFNGYFSEKNGLGSQYYSANGNGQKKYDLKVGTTFYAYWIEKTWTDYLTTTSFGGGTGTLHDPYIISNQQHLALLSNNVNNGKSYEGEYFRLLNDLDMSEHAWMPIGKSSSYSFLGNFDGDNHIISGLHIDRQSVGLVGLFGQIGSTTSSKLSSVSNLKISNTTYNLFYAYAYENVGAIVGLASNAKIENCSSNAILNIKYYPYAYDMFVGGIVGRLKGENSIIENCYYYGNLTSDAEAMGGIVGCSDGGLITNCLNEGTLENSSSYYNKYIGGIAGKANWVEKCITKGSITSFGYIGGLVGQLTSVNNKSILKNCAGYGSLNSSNTTIYIAGIAEETYLGSIISNCTFVGESNTDKIKMYYSTLNGKPSIDSCYVVLNEIGIYSNGNFNSFTIASNFNNGLPIQNDLFSIGVWENQGDKVIEFFTDNDFSKVVL